MEGTPKFEAANENSEGWSELKEKAPEMALAKLTERGLVNDIESATLAEVEQLVASLPLLMEELSDNEEGEVRNENRYVVRELSLLLNKAEKKVAYEKAPAPLLSAA